MRQVARSLVAEGYGHSFDELVIRSADPAVILAAFQRTPWVHMKGYAMMGETPSAVATPEQLQFAFACAELEGHVCHLIVGKDTGVVYAVAAAILSNAALLLGLPVEVHLQQVRNAYEACLAMAAD